MTADVWIPILYFGGIAALFVFVIIVAVIPLARQGVKIEPHHPTAFDRCPTCRRKFPSKSKRTLNRKALK